MILNSPPALQDYIISFLPFDKTLIMYFITIDLYYNK